jgi:hypothetical protein
VEQEADQGGERDPEQDLFRGDQEVAPEQAAVGVERLGHLMGGGQDERKRLVVQVDVQFPDSD